MRNRIINFILVHRLVCLLVTVLDKHNILFKTKLGTPLRAIFGMVTADQYIDDSRKWWDAMYIRHSGQL